MTQPALSLRLHVHRGMYSAAIWPAAKCDTEDGDEEEEDVDEDLLSVSHVFAEHRLCARLAAHGAARFRKLLRITGAWGGDEQEIRECLWIMQLARRGATTAADDAVGAAAGMVARALQVVRTGAAGDGGGTLLWIRMMRARCGPATWMHVLRSLLVRECCCDAVFGCVVRVSSSAEMSFSVMQFLRELTRFLGTGATAIRMIRLHTSSQCLQVPRFFFVYRASASSAPSSLPSTFVRPSLWKMFEYAMLQLGGHELDRLYLLAESEADEAGSAIPEWLQFRELALRRILWEK